MVDGRPARPAAERTVQIDNGRVRVSRWRFAPGAETGRQRHNFAFVAIELKDCSSR